MAMVTTLPSMSSILGESIGLLAHNPSFSDNDDDDDDDQSVELDETSWTLVTSDESHECQGQSQGQGQSGCSDDGNLGRNGDVGTNKGERTVVKKKAFSDSVGALGHEVGRGGGIGERTVVKKESFAGIKDELRNKIQGRRMSAGVGELKVEFQPPKKYSLTEEEKAKYEKRKQRNRDSANRSRLKRKFQLEYLEKEVKELTQTHEELVAQVNGLMQHKNTLKQYISSHDCKLAGTSTASHNGSTSSAHAQSIKQPEKSAKSDGYNRGHAAFLKLTPDQQMKFLKLYVRRHSAKDDDQQIAAKASLSSLV